LSVSRAKLRVRMGIRMRITTMAIVTIVATYHFNNRVGRWFPIVPLSLPTLATVTAASVETGDKTVETGDSDGVSLPASVLW